jgi:hypothetical protein
MGRTRKGLFGGFEGRVGTVVGSTWKDVTYLKSGPKKRSGGFTPAQLVQQAKYRVLMAFLKRMTEIVDIGFKGQDNSMTAFNKAFSYNVRNAMSGSFPSFTVDYPDVLVSDGNLPNGLSPTANATGSGGVSFYWTDNTGVGQALGTDKAMLVAYCPAVRFPVFKTGGAMRSAELDTLDLTSFTGETVETWISFISADGQLVSTSFYTGQVVVT